METLYIILIAVVLLIIAVFVSKKWGEATAKKDQAEDNADVMEKYETIDNQPDIDNPFDRLRKKD